MNWFKHDTNATTDAKIKKLLIKYGAIGYAVYFHCLELIASNVSETNITFELEHDAEIIADDLRIRGDSQKSGTEIVEEIMYFMIELDLFEESNGHIFCFKLLKRLDTSMTSNPKMRALISSAKENIDNIMPNHDEVMINHDTIMQDKIRIDKIRIDKNSICADESDTKAAPINPFILKTGGAWYLSLELYENYKNAYSKIDVDMQLKKMQSWLMSNPPKRKTANGMPKFINSWLSRAESTNNNQDKNKSLNLSDKISLGEM